MATASTKYSCPCLGPFRLFMCHQMAMKKEADDKQKAAEERRTHNAIPVPIVWILGGPGCGKGTQCAKIVCKYKFTHLSTGDLLREEVNSGSERGKRLADVMAEGKLVANEEVLFLLSIAVRKAIPDSKGFLIDGYPREKDQGAAFEKSVSPADLIIFFDCDDDVLVERILKRASTSDVVRADDNPETLKTRIATFRSNTNEILEQYTDKTVVINADRTVSEIFADVVQAIDTVIEKKRAIVAAGLID